MVHLLIYIRDNRTLGLNYYAYTKVTSLSDLLIKASIKNDNQLMDFSDSSCQDFPYNDRSTGTYIIFYQGGPIENGTHVLVTVYQ